MKPHRYQKHKENSWAWWCAPVVPATREAEAGESLDREVEDALSRDRTTALQPGQQSKTPSHKKKTNFYFLVKKFILIYAPRLFAIARWNAILF